jgi:hypothetical protein
MTGSSPRTHLHRRGRGSRHRIGHTAERYAQELRKGDLATFGHVSAEHRDINEMAAEFHTELDRRLMHFETFVRADESDWSDDRRAGHSSLWRAHRTLHVSVGPSPVRAVTCEVELSLSLPTPLWRYAAFLTKIIASYQELSRQELADSAVPLVPHECRVAVSFPDATGEFVGYHLCASQLEWAMLHPGSLDAVAAAAVTRHWVERMLGAKILVREAVFDAFEELERDPAFAAGLASAPVIWAAADDTGERLARAFAAMLSRVADPHAAALLRALLAAAAHTEEPAPLVSVIEPTGTTRAAPQKGATEELVREHMYAQHVLILLDDGYSASVTIGRTLLHTVDRWI